jgi:hypothetical protein
MAEVVVIEFSSPDAVSIYNRVNKIIGWEGEPDSEAWPDGMISHIAAEAGDKLIVVEAWESQADQERFMAAKLGPAFHEANVPQPTRVEWFAGVINVHS